MQIMLPIKMSKERMRVPIHIDTCLAVFYWHAFSVSSPIHHHSVLTSFSEKVPFYMTYVSVYLLQF